MANDTAILVIDLASTRVDGRAAQITVFDEAYDNSARLYSRFSSVGGNNVHYKTLLPKKCDNMPRECLVKYLLNLYKYSGDFIVTDVRSV